MMSEETKELIVFDQIDPLELFTSPKKIEEILSTIEAHVLSFVPDTTTSYGRKEIASLAYRVSRSKTALDDLGKKLVADWKSKSAQVDAERKLARDKLDSLRDKVRQPLTDWEVAEAAKKEADRLAVQIEMDHSRALLEHDLWIKAKEIAAKEAEIARIEADRKAKEEAERFEAQRKENEDRIRVEAERKANKLAEEAAVAKIKEAELREKEATLSAEREKAKALAELAAMERREKERLEIERKTKEEAERRNKDIEHRKTVNASVADDLVSIGIEKGQANRIVFAITKGKIRHTIIEY